jgi:hypothetical protein
MAIINFNSISGVSTISVASSITVGNNVLISGDRVTATTFSGNVNSTSGVTTVTTLNATSIVGVTTAGITTAYIGSVNDGPLSGARNLIINGDMRISQRGTSFSPAATGIRYCLDRFYTQSSSNNITITQSSDAPVGFTSSLLLTMGTATTLDYMRVGTSIEGNNFSNLAFGTSGAKSFTISFWVKCSLTGTFGIGFRNPTTSLDGTGTTTSRLASYTINAANTWEYKTITIPGATSQTWGSSNDIGICIMWDIGDSAARSGSVDTTWQTSNTSYPVGLTGGTKVANTTGATWYLTGVQLEVGTVATPFERRSYGQELALCQRYYEIGAVNVVGGGASYWCGRVTGSTYARQSVSYKVTKRAVPGTITAITGDYGTFSSAAPTVNNSTIHGFAWYKLATGTSDDGYVAIDWYSSAEL